MTTRTALFALVAAIIVAVEGYLVSWPLVLGVFAITGFAIAVVLGRQRKT